MNQLLKAAEDLIDLYESSEQMDELYEAIERLKEACMDVRVERIRKLINNG